MFSFFQTFFSMPNNIPTYDKTLNDLIIQNKLISSSKQNKAPTQPNQNSQKTYSKTKQRVKLYYFTVIFGSIIVKLQYPQIKISTIECFWIRVSENVSKNNSIQAVSRN